MDKPTPWYGTLDEATREKVFAVMRAIDAESQSFYASAQRLAPRYNEVAVGSADHDAAISGESRRAFLSYLRRGKTPDEAAELAKADCQKLIGEHNARRKDYMAQRWTGGQDICIDGLMRRIKTAAGAP